MKLRSWILWFWPSLVLMALGLSQLHVVYSGQINSMLHPVFRPFVQISGVLLLILALANVWVKQPETPVSTAAFWRTIGSGAGTVGLIVVGIGLAPQSFSALAWQNRGFTNQPSAVAQGKPFKSVWVESKAEDGGEILHCEVFDLVLAANDPDSVRALEGKAVQFIGQYSQIEPGLFNITRLLMICCAADAQPMKVQVHGTSSGAVEMDWVQVTGKVHFKPEGNQWRAEVVLGKVETTPAPEEVFLY